MENKTNVAVVGEFTLLKNKLTAIIEKEGNATNPSMLICSKVDNPESVTLADLTVDLKNIFNMNEDERKKITDSIDTLQKDNTNTSPVAFQLKSAFLYYKDGAVQEFAISITTNFNTNLKLNGISLTSIGLAVWNTERETIKKQMGFASIAKVLEDLK